MCSINSHKISTLWILRLWFGWSYGMRVKDALYGVDEIESFNPISMVGLEEPMVFDWEIIWEGVDCEFMKDLLLVISKVWNYIEDHICWVHTSLTLLWHCEVSANAQ